MIVFDLLCDGGHRFEGWFGSSADYERQQLSALIGCPVCGSVSVGKAVMAPAIGRKGNQVPAIAPVRAEPAAASAAPAAPARSATPPAIPPQAMQMMRALATMQAKALENSRWVGDGFAENARAIHYGERDAELIHGKATPKEAEALIEEGITVSPLPFPVVPSEQAN